jgi:hypothetical protein
MAALADDPTADPDYKPGLQEEGSAADPIVIDTAQDAPERGYMPGTSGGAEYVKVPSTCCHELLAGIALHIIIVVCGLAKHVSIHPPTAPAAT